jgi:hypothetical protein
MIKLYSLIAALLFSSMLIAAPQSHNHSDKHPELAKQAHLHGTAQLTLALEGNTLKISLESPAANIVGFEHKATSDKHIKAVEEAKASLEASGLFVFSGSDCSLKQAEVDMSSVIEQGRQHRDHDDDEGHSEISASYSYECAKGEKLETVSVNLMSRFPAVETLEVMWLTSRQQGATKLKSQSNLIRIR